MSGDLKDRLGARDVTETVHAEAAGLDVGRTIVAQHLHQGDGTGWEPRNAHVGILL
jgi:hypothetical protein